MKKYIILITLALLPVVAFAQGAFDALRFSQYRYEGSARSMAMGNAFTSLGGDSYSMSINPAASAIYRYSEFTFTPSLVNSSIESHYLNNSERESWNRVGISNIGFVTPFKALPNSFGLNSLTFGVAINKLNNFSSRIYSYGVNNNSSWLASMADGLTGLDNSNLDITDDWNPFFDNSGASWSEILAWNSYLIDPLSNTDYIGASENIDANGIIYLAGALGQEFYREQRGSISEVVFNMGANFSDRLFFGVNLGLQSVDFEDYQKYSEIMLIPSLFDSNLSDFTHHYRQHSSGVGLNFKVGVIAIPFDGLRIGASISTPTWLYLKDNWDETIYSRFADGDTYDVLSPIGEYSYRVYTPARWSLGASYVIGKIGLISLDYEGADYSSITMLTKDGDKREFAQENNYISNQFQSARVLRAGAEIKPTPQIALRAGYTKYENPEKELGYESQYISGGIGFSGSGGIFLDLAFQKRVTDNDFYSLYADYSNHNAPIGTHDITGWKLLVTLGFRF